MTNYIMSFIGAILGSSITIILFGYYIFKTDFSNVINDEFRRNKFIN